MSLLTLIQSHCQRNTLAVPATVIGNSDTTVVQLLTLLNDLVGEMVDESQFQAFTREATFSLIAAEDQGAIGAIADDGFLWMHNETFFDRTLARQVFGPISDVEWQSIKALPNPGPWYKYRIRQNRLLINPVPVTPYSVVAFEYASSYGVVAVDGTTFKAAFTVDTDTFTLPEKLLSKGLEFKWKRQKGLNYQGEEIDYYKMLNNYIARDGSKRPINMACGTPTTLQPGIYVPAGNWPVS